LEAFHSLGINFKALLGCLVEPGLILFFNSFGVLVDFWKILEKGGLLHEVRKIISLFLKRLIQIGLFLKKRPHCVHGLKPESSWIRHPFGILFSLALLPSVHKRYFLQGLERICYTQTQV